MNKKLQTPLNLSLTLVISCFLTVFSFAQNEAINVKKTETNEVISTCTVKLSSYDEAVSKQFIHGLSQYTGRITNVVHDENKASFQFNSSISLENIKEICMAYVIDFNNVVITSNIPKSK